MSTSVRCTAHPSRPAVDDCPTCGQPRCGVDAQGATCRLCTVQDVPAVRRPPVVPQVLLALLGAAAVAAVASFVCAEYVEAGFLQYVLPVVTGVLCGATGLWAARSRGEGAVGWVLRVLTALVAVGGVAYGFALEGSQDPVTGDVALPYGLAVLGCLAWTQPVRRRRVG